MNTRKGDWRPDSAPRKAGRGKVVLLVVALAGISLGTVAGLFIFREDATPARLRGGSSAPSADPSAEAVPTGEGVEIQRDGVRIVFPNGQVPRPNRTRTVPRPGEKGAAPAGDQPGY